MDIKYKETDVAIVGMGFRLPGDPKTPDEFFYNLLNKKDCITPCPRERWNNDFFKSINESEMGGYIDRKDLQSLDKPFFNLSLDDCITLEPQGKIIVKCAYECFENANMTIDKIRGSNISVYVGAHFLEYRFMNSNGPYFISYAPFVANTVSYCFDLRGNYNICESVFVNTACSSSFSALQMGYESIVNGKSEISLVGGANSMLNQEFLTNLSIVGDMSTNVVSKQGRSFTFEENADGYCRAEGGVVILLKKLSKAIQDGDKIYGLIKNVQCNNDGYLEKNGKFNPSSIGQASNIKDALERISMKPSDIYYLEPHGTGTATGDPIEMKAISMAFNRSSNEEPLYIGSTKPTIGHLESVSGLVSLMKACLMIKHRTLVPMFNFTNPNSKIKFDEWNLKVLNEPKEFPKDKVVNIGINNFGICGTNYFAIISEYVNSDLCDANNNFSVDDAEIEKVNEKQFLIPFSANSKKSLEAYQSKLISSIDSIKNKVTFKDFAKSICNKFNFFSRNVVLAKNWEEFKELNIVSVNESNIISTSSFIYKTPVVFVFCGQGTQYPQMASQLYNSNKVFRNSVDHCDNLFSKYFGFSVFEKFRSFKENERSVNEPFFAQPAIFTIQYGLIELYKHWGIVPSAVIGHSFGEISMGYASGMISLENIVEIIYYRGIAQNKTIGMGKMLSISIGKQEFYNKFSNEPYFGKLEIGCYNAQNSIVIASELEHLEKVKNKLQTEGKMAILLNSLSPFHSSKIEFIKDDLLSINVKSSNSPKITAFSTVTGKKWDSNNDKFDSIHTYKSVAYPVLFHEALQSIIKDQDINHSKNIIFVELAPRPTLSYYLKGLNDGETKITVINPITKNSKDDIKLFNESIGKIHCNGGTVNFLNQFPKSNNNSYKWVSHYLPKYSWDDQEFWYEDELHYYQRTAGPACGSLGLKEISNGNIVYQTIIELKREHYNFIKDHKVGSEIYYPGVGYLEALIKYYKDKKSFKVSSLNCLNPFILNIKSKYYLQLVITKLSNHEDYYQFFKKELIVGLNSNSYDSWLEVCNGKVSTLPLSIPQDKKNINEIKSQCNKTIISKEELYSTIKEYFNVSFGPTFQKVDKIYAGDKTFLSEGSINNKLSYFDNDYFNIPILDSSLHAQFIINMDYRNKNIVLDRIEDYKIYLDKIPKERGEKLYYLATLTKTIGKSNYYDLSICLEDGTVLTEGSAVSTYIKPIKDKIVVENPTGLVYSNVWQSKDSPLKEPYSIKMKKISDEFIPGFHNPKPLNNFIAYKYIKSFEKRNIPITKEAILNSNEEQLIEKYLPDKKSTNRKRLFTKAINIIKNNNDLLIDQILKDNQFNPMEYLKQYYGDDIEKFFSIVDIDGVDLQVSEIYKPTSQIEIEKANVDKFKLVTNNDIPDFLYKKSIKHLHDEFCNRIINMLKPILNLKYTFKIVEFGGGTCGLAYFLLKEINQLLEDNPHLLQIHYNFSDVSSSFLPDAKKLLGNFKNINIVYNVYDLDKSLIKQGLNQSSHDMVLMQFVLHAVKNVEFSVKEIYQILNPSGHVMCYEPSKHDSLSDMFFSNFEQWNHYNDNIRSDHCCLDVNEWVKLFGDNGFNPNISCSKDLYDNRPFSFIFDVQKPPLVKPSHSNNDKLYNQVFIYGPRNNQYNQLYNYYSNVSNSIHYIKNISEIRELSDSNNLIIYSKGFEKLNGNNIEKKCMELTSCFQYLINNNLQTKCKFILFTIDSQIDSKNYINSSLIGVIKYFFIHQDVKCYSIDFDDNSFNQSNLETTFNIIKNLIKDGNYIERYFVIRNNQVLIEKIYNENNQTIKTESFENEHLLFKLNNKLKYELVCKPTNIHPNQVEVKTITSGLNYQDQSVIKNNQTQTINNLGVGFSGVITKIGSNVFKFKVGDIVFGYTEGNGLSSNVIVDQNNCLIKPSNLSFENASIIPHCYTLAYYSLFNFGNIDNSSSILIHSASSEIGLATLSLLKWKKLNNLTIFATVGTEEKKQFILQKFGKLINGGIFSNKDNGFVSDIKKFNQIHNKSGVDIIINTLSHDYLSENLSILSNNGSFIDHSISKIEKNEYISFNSICNSSSFKYIKINFNTIGCQKSNILNKLSTIIENGEIDLDIPITSYKINEVQDRLLQDIKNKSFIGSLVINYDEEFYYRIIKDNKFKNNVLKENYSIKDNEYLGSTILITGQRGLALHTTKWISRYSKNVKDIIIFSKSQKLHWEMEYIFNQNINKFGNKINYHFKCVDVGNMNQVKNAINEIYSHNKSIKPVESIFHYAFALSDEATLKVSINNFIEANNAKTHGALNLHIISLELNWKLKTFLLNSSLSCTTGSESQIGYISSNSIVEGLARYRRSIGLNAIVVKWGALESSYVTRNTIVNFKDLKTLSIQKILGCLDISIQSQDIITEISFTKTLQSNVNKLYTNHFDHTLIASNKPKDDENIDKLNKDGKPLSIKEIILNKISNLLQVDPDKINLNMKLKDYGSDSLLMVQFKNWLEKDYIPISLDKLQNSTIHNIINLISTSQDSSAPMNIDNNKQSIEQNISPSKVLGKSSIESHSNDENSESPTKKLKTI